MPNPMPSVGRTGRALRSVLGGALVVVGIPLLVLPGPGLLLIGAGLGLLGWNQVRSRRARNPRSMDGRGAEEEGHTQ